MGQVMILLAVTIAFWMAGWTILGRIKKCDHRDSSPFAGKTVSIIIPARDEEKNLPTLLRSITSQSVRPDEIIVVDDASTDHTVQVARDNGARVVSSQPLPEGWRGKTWACQQGACVATGEWLLFLDADTWFEPEGLHRVLTEFKEAKGGVLSVAPYHVVRDWHEQFSSFFNLVMLAGTGAFTILGDHLAPRGLLGQCMLIDRHAYERAGGHESVKGKILENFWLANRLRGLGIPLHCRSGRGVFSFRMYPLGMRELVGGWTKGFASGAGQTPLPLLLLVIAWMSGLMLAPAGLAFAFERWHWATTYGLCVAQVWWLLRQVGTFHWSVSVFYPVTLIFYFVVFARSMQRSHDKKAVTWKGRQVRAD